VCHPCMVVGRRVLSGSNACAADGGDEAATATSYYAHVSTTDNRRAHSSDASTHLPSAATMAPIAPSEWTHEKGESARRVDKRRTLNC
jgi:hypothetical protein